MNLRAIRREVRGARQNAFCERQDAFHVEFIDKRATRAEAIAAWTELKELDIPKDYSSWTKARTRKADSKQP